jgi:uncharacterized membrane protein
MKKIILLLMPLLVVLVSMSVGCDVITHTEERCYIHGFEAGQHSGIGVSAEEALKAFKQYLNGDITEEQYVAKVKGW